MLAGAIGITNTHTVGVVHDALIAAAARAHPAGDDVLGAAGRGRDVRRRAERHRRLPRTAGARRRGAGGRERRAGGRGQRRRRDRDDLPRAQGRHRHRVAPRRRRMDRRRAGPGQLRDARAAAHRWRAGRRSDPARRGAVPVGPGRGAQFKGRARGRLDHRHRGNRCAAPPPPVRAAGAAGRDGRCAHGQLRVARLGRPVLRLCHRQPRTSRTMPARTTRGPRSDLRMVADSSTSTRCSRPSSRRTEEAITNALLAAETMTGRDGITAHALDPHRLVSVMRAHGRLDHG